MGGGASRKDQDDDDIDVAALVANVRRNERNVFEVPLSVRMVKGKKNGAVVTVPCTLESSVTAFKQRIAGETGDALDALTLAYGTGHAHEGKLLFIETKGPKAFDFNEDVILLKECGVNKSTGLVCHASKDINLDAYDPKNIAMLNDNCERGLRKPMKKYTDAYRQAVNHWVDEDGLPEREEMNGGPKVPFERFHCEAIKHATLTFADPRKHKTWGLKFKQIKANSPEEKSVKSNAIFHKQARIQVDAYLAVFFNQVEKALAAFPPNITGHRELVWERIHEVVDRRIDEVVGEFKANLEKKQAARIKNAIYAKLWFDDDVENIS